MIAAALLGAGIVLFLWKKNKKAHLGKNPQNICESYLLFFTSRFNNHYVDVHDECTDF